MCSACSKCGCVRACMHEQGCGLGESRTELGVWVAVGREFGELPCRWLHGGGQAGWMDTG